MVENKKIKLLLAVLLAFIICIFSLGIGYEDIEIPDDAGYKLHQNKDNYHMTSENTSYSYDDKPLSYKIIYEDETFEEFEKEAIEYKGFVDEAIALWIDAGKTYSEDPDYEIINMEEVESGGKGTVKLDYNKDKGFAWTDADNYDENDPNREITSWTITINLAKFEKKNADGTYYYSDDDKAKIIAHEIGHVYGLDHLKDENYKDQIMYFKQKKNSSKLITEKDIAGMEVCTESFDTIIYEDEDYCVATTHCGGCIKIPHEFTSSQVLVGTQDICRKTVRTCGLCGYSYVLYFDRTHSWADMYDAVCNDCGYIKTIEVTEEDGLLNATIHGQSWILNIAGSGTEFQYKSSYTLPSGGILIWNDVGNGNPYHRYCYNYNGIDYIYGDQYTSLTTQFTDLREMTKVWNEETLYYYKLRYILDRLDLRYRDQWIQTTQTLQGGFYAQLLGNETIGYYVVIYRVLVDGAGNKYTYAEVWAPSMKIPVYFSH